MRKNLEKLFNQYADLARRNADLYQYQEAVAFADLAADAALKLTVTARGMQETNRWHANREMWRKMSATWEKGGIC